MATRIQPHITPFPMDRGIDKILHLIEDEKVDGATAGDIAPAFSPVKPRLEQLYALPNLEDYLASQLSPLMDEAGLLMPNRFNRALRDGEEELKEDEEEDPRRARILRAARRLLGDQVALRELVKMYQMALLKG
ncbi:hypothetical protein [Caenimonas sp. SL110]|uniref:type III secretion apparatus assembly protein SctX n=1 Tax=Caenimonas sp. SL110 TaxID=1450524 RepID=UPI0006542ABA|nr:hypothetical protein [Caenimonas sp. SL110]